MINGKMKGHLALIGANTIWGLYAPLCKDLINTQAIPPLALAGIKTTGAALLFWMVSFLMPSSIVKKEKIERCDWMKLVIASLMIIAANQICITLGLQYASPVDGTVLCSITPFFTLALAFIFLKQKIKLLPGIGALIGFAGMLVFVFGGETNSEMHVSNPLLGDSLFVMSQFCGAIYLVFSGSILAKYSSLTLMKWMFLISALIMTPFTVDGLMNVEWNVLDTAMWAEFGYIIVFATFAAFLLLPVGQKHVSPTSVAMYNYLQPVVTTVFALVFGIAVLTGSTILATALILVGVYMVNRN